MLIAMKPIETTLHMTRKSEMARRAAEGDRRAFDRLVRPQLGHLLALCRRLTAGHGENAAEELLQTGLIRAHTGLAGFDGRGTFRAWVSGILYRLATEPDRYRGLRSLPGQMPLGDLSREVVPDALADDPSEAASARELLAQVEAAMERLPVRLRTALHLRTVEGLGYTEIADVLDTSESATRNAVMDARRRLRERMGDVLS